MAATQIITFNVNPILEADDQRTVDDVIQEAVKALREASSSRQFVLGAQVQDNGIVQMTSKWDSSVAQGSDSLLESLSSALGPVEDIYHVVFHQEAVENDDPTTANVVEFVQTRFPVSRISPEFQREIEKDFLRFDEIYLEEVKGHLGCTYGWVLETQKIEGEDVKSFFVMRGWESMDSFEQSTQTDAFKKSIPILLGWNAPFRMVRISSYKLVTGS
jgi:quinol monooxygenase YgiN